MLDACSCHRKVPVVRSNADKRLLVSYVNTVFASMTMPLEYELLPLVDCEAHNTAPLAALNARSPTEVPITAIPSETPTCPIVELLGHEVVEQAAFHSTAPVLR